MIDDSIRCPACHFECVLVNYQCARGKEFYDMAAAGEEVPERRGPMITPSERADAGGDGRPPLNNRVMHGLNIMANKLQKRHVEAGEHKVVLALSKAGSFMTPAFLAKRMLISPDELDAGLEDARAAGFVVVETDERGFEMARLTEAGKQQAAEWQADQDASTAQFLSALSDEEKETLETLIRKLLAMR